MSLRGLLKELHHRNVFKVAAAYTAAAVVLLEVLTHLFHNFEAPHWVLKVITTLLIVGLPVACLMAWGFEFKEGGVRSVPRVPKDTKPAMPAPKVTAPPSIAVLPFVDMSAEHDQQYLGDGIAEELLNALASIEDLNVAARTSSFSFAGKGASSLRLWQLNLTTPVRQPADSSLIAPAFEPAFRMPPSSNTRPAAWGYRASHNAFGLQRHREVRRTMYLFDALREHLDPSVQIRNQQSSDGQCDLRKCRRLTSRLHST